MSVAGITSINSTQLANVQQNLHKVQNEFKQLGQDLQSGNLTQAQADFVTLSQSLSSPPNFLGPTAVQQAAGTTAGSSANSPNTVGPTALPQPASASHHRVHLHQALTQLGQALQAGNLGAAQQAFATMSQIWQQFTSNSTPSSTGTQATPVNVSA